MTGPAVGGGLSVEGAAPKVEGEHGMTVAGGESASRAGGAARVPWDGIERAGDRKERQHTA